MNSKKNSNPSRAPIDPLRFTVIFEEPLASIFLEECQREDRDMATMVRWVMKRYFFGRLPGQEQKAKSSPMTHLGDQDSELGSQGEQTG